MNFILCMWNEGGKGKDNTNLRTCQVRSKCISNTTETILAFEDKLNDETNQLFVLKLWGRKWNLIIRYAKNSVKDVRFETPRGTLHLVQVFSVRNIGIQAGPDWYSGPKTEIRKWTWERHYREIEQSNRPWRNAEGPKEACAGVGFQHCTRITSSAVKTEWRTVSLSCRHVWRREKGSCLSDETTISEVGYKKIRSVRKTTIILGMKKITIVVDNIPLTLLNFYLNTIY